MNLNKVLSWRVTPEDEYNSQDFDDGTAMSIDELKTERLYHKHEQFLDTIDDLVVKLYAEYGDNYVISYTTLGFVQSMYRGDTVIHKIYEDGEVVSTEQEPI